MVVARAWAKTRRLFGAIALVLTAAVLGCRAGPTGPTAAADLPPLEPIRIQVDHRPGGPLLKTAAGIESKTTAPPVRVTSRWIAVRAGDLPPLPPLGTRARLVTATQVDQPILAATRLTRDARFDVPADPSPFTGGTIVAEVSAAALAGTTLSFREATNLDPKTNPLPHLELALFRPTEESADWALSVIVTGLVPDPSTNLPDDEEPAGEQPPQVPPAMVVQRERAIVDDIAWSAADQPLLLRVTIPRAFAAAPAAGRSSRREARQDLLLVELRVEPVASPAVDLELLAAQAREDLARSVNAAAADPPPAQRATEALIESVTPLLQDPRSQRRALLFVSAQTDAKILQDATLVADDAILARLAAAVTDQTAAGEAPTTPARLGLALDLVTLKVLGELQSAGNVPEEQRSVLLRHAGEVGRSAGAIDDLLSAGAISSRADLEARLVAENLIALQDASPAARVRAFDWLEARGRAPEGYDPLAPPRQRRAALERALTGATTEPTSPNR